MAAKKPHYDYSVFIGRFQPFHLGHFETIKWALTKSDHIIILVGSAFSSRNIKNPFTWQERRDMITESLSSEGIQNFTVMPIRDFYYSDNAWVAQIQRNDRLISGPNDSIGLVSHKKDSTGYYLDLFPTWGSLNVIDTRDLDATDIRADYFEFGSSEYATPGRVGGFLKSFESTPAYKVLAEEWKMIKAYKKSWESSPFPPVFVTTDAVLVCGGHILLVKRKAAPGRGLLALPGGFIDGDEQLENGCIRELKEETRIRVPPLKIKGCIEGRKVFDHPLRSTRGRTITHAFYINLQNEEGLPKVKGGDDASHAFWMKLSEVSEKMEEFFEDHFQIIDNFINLPQRAE